MKKTVFSSIVLIAGLMMLPHTVFGDRAITRISDLNHGNSAVGHFRALIIAIDDYYDPAIPDLETPINDANALDRILRSSYGFETQLITGSKATRRGIYNALRSLAASAKTNESILIYFGGHGELDRQYNDGWWIPYDAKGGDAVTYLDNTEVQKAMGNMNARHVLLISDSCYSGSLFGSSRSVPPVINEKYYLNLYNEKSRWGMTSGNKEPVSDSGTAGHSVFAYQLIRALEKNDKPYLTVQELYTQIAPIIGNNSEQTPLCKPVRQTGDQGGQFLFLLASSGAYIDRPLQAQSDSKNSTLSVSCNVPDSQVILDGVLLGTGNLQNRSIPPGLHSISVEKSGYTAYTTKVTVAPGRTVALQAYLDPVSTPKSTLHVDTEPGDAIVSILNIRPKYYSGIELSPGRYEVKVMASGYTSESQWVTVGPGEDKRVFIRLTQEGDARAEGKRITNSTGMTFAYITPGTYVMGSPKSETGRGRYEKQHDVTLTKGFYMQTTEVTQGQWTAVMGNNPSQFSDCGDACPVEWVSWNDANEFVNRLNSMETGRTYRLPTEAEWEYACRAGTTTRFSWGDQEDCHKSNYGNGFSQQCKDVNPGKTMKVASFPANAFGLHDMHGNVREMCSDFYGLYPSGSETDPQGPSIGLHRVNRGGSWDYDARDCRSAKRNYATSGDRSRYTGFRVVLTTD